MTRPRHSWRESASGSMPREWQGTSWRQGDIYLVSLDPTVGREQRGLQTVLIASCDIFNHVPGTAIIVPITSGGDLARRTGYAVSLAATRTRTTGIIRCDQIRSVDLPAREAKFLESVPPAVVEEVLARVETLFRWFYPSACLKQEGPPATVALLVTTAAWTTGTSRPSPFLQTSLPPVQQSASPEQSRQAR
jgi:mRNA interferase ChpB